jgi:hypothetical protein
MSLDRTLGRTASPRSDFFLCLSLANLMFFKPWSDLLLMTERLPHADWAYEALATRWSTYVGLILDVVLCAMVLWTIVTVASKIWGAKGKLVSHLFLLGLGFFAVNGFRLALHLGYLTSTIPHWSIYAILAISVAALIAIVLRVPEQFIGGFRSALFVMLPFSVVTFGHAFYGLFFYTKTPSLAVTVAHAPKPHRIIWWLFDEWDYRIGFEERPKGLELPEIDRFRQQAFSGERVYPPGGYTAVSIPGYFTGRIIDKPPWVDRQRDLKVHFADDKGKSKWSDHENIFSELKNDGNKSAVIGWYLPYCNMLDGLVDRCSKFPHYNLFKQPYTASLPESMVNLAKDMAYLLPNRSKFQVETYDRILKATLETVSDRSFDFVYTHWPAPHAPWIYDRDLGKVTEHNQKGPEGYLDNLVLVDRTLGKLRAELERQGTWENTTILLSTDHGWNSSKEYDGRQDFRIPFLLKMEGQTEGRQYTRAFNARILKNLFLSISRGEIRDADQVGHWLDTHTPELPTGSNS